MKKNLVKSLGAYTLAAGAAAGLGGAATANATVVVYDNGGAGWFNAIPEWGTENVFTDMIQFQCDGTVLVGEVDIEAEGVYAGRFTLGHDGLFDWAEPDDKDSSLLLCGVGTGFVSGNGRDVAWLGGGEIVGDYDVLPAGRTWWHGDATAASVPSDWANAGGFQGYNYYQYGEWFFGGRGFVGLYQCLEDGLHYGWADITTNGPRNEFTLHAFGFSDEKSMWVYAGGQEVPEPMTLSVLALGATGLLARRKRA